MKRSFKGWLAVMAAALLVTTTAPATSSAQSSGSSLGDTTSQPATTTAPLPQEAPVGAGDVPDIAPIDGPFAQWGIPTPPGAEGYEVNQVEDEDLNPRGLDEWHPTVNPKDRVIPGQMRSDKEPIPAGISKAEADKAEVREAKLTNPEAPTLNARPGCGVYWPTWFEVCGAIKDKYDQIGGPLSFLLLPKSNELTNPDGVGRRSEFINGFIYWHPHTGAHSVSLPVSTVWARHGWEGGFLGYPTTSDIPQGGDWYKQDFQGGHVYTHNALPPVQSSIQGAIYDKWQSMGAQNSDLGYPISDELTTPDGRGRYNVFEGGMIYWTPETGAHDVRGLPLVIWALKGYEKSEWGYPTGSGQSAPDAPVLIKQNFSKKQLDARKIIESAGESLVNGKEINNFILELIRSRGMTLESPHLQRSGAVQQTFASASRCPIPDSTQRQYGGVTIPSSYDYWACLPNSKNMERIARHDYCTKSPDQFPAPGQNAEFSGPCSRHDMCMDKSDRQGVGYGPCNGALAEDMNRVCKSVYGSNDPRRYGCFDFRDTYWVVVTAWNSRNL